MKKKFMLNPDINVVREVQEGLNAKNGHCPCMVGKTEDNKCPCKNFRLNQICKCNLYVEKK